MKRYGRVFVAILVLATMVSIPGWAHKPISIGRTYSRFDRALALENIDVSQVIYAKLSAAKPWLWLMFTLEAPAELHASLGVPALERLVDARPQLILLGPRLPMIHLPVAAPEGYGGLVLSDASSQEPRVFHEPFTGTDSWIHTEWTAELTEPGTYYLLAGAGDGVSDKLWVAVGRREAFGWRDLVALPSIIRAVREFHEVPARSPRWQGLGKILFLGLSALAIALLAAP